MANFPPIFDPQALGGKFDILQTSLTVNATAQYVTEANQKRVALAFINYGATTLFFNPTQVAAANNGWRLLTNQPALDFVWSDWGPIVGSNWSCISNAPGGSLGIVELIYNAKRR